MRWTTIIVKGAAVFFIAGSVLVRAQPTDIGKLFGGTSSIVWGQCSAESHIAEGAIGQDLTKRQSRLFCDSVVITVFGENKFPKHVMVQFAESNSVHGRQIGYAGLMQDDRNMDLTNVYLEEGRPTKPTGGFCKFEYKGSNLSNMACVADIDVGKSRTVTASIFDASSKPAGTQKSPVIDCDQPRNADDIAFCHNGKPYLTVGSVNCSLPGTIIEFGLDGSGTAEVTRIESNFAPMRNAAQQGHPWSTRLIEKDGAKILIIDNGERTRIMVGLPSGKGTAFVDNANGVSDILCRMIEGPSDRLTRSAVTNPAGQPLQSVSPLTAQQSPSLDALKTSSKPDSLMHCVDPEVQYGEYSSYDGGKSVMKVLEGKCSREYLAFVESCSQSGTPQNTCVLSAATAAQFAIKRFGK